MERHQRRAARVPRCGVRPGRPHRGHRPARAGLRGTFAPALSRAVVTPIVGEVFAARAAQDALGDVLARLQMTVTEAAAAMAEGVAFLILAVFFLLILSIVLSPYPAQPASFDPFPAARLAQPPGGRGARPGRGRGGRAAAPVVRPPGVSGPVFELGWLSPARIQSTVLLRGLLAYFPI